MMITLLIHALKKKQITLKSSKNCYSNTLKTKKLPPRISVPKNRIRRRLDLKTMKIQLIIFYHRSQPRYLENWQIYFKTTLMIKTFQRTKSFQKMTWQRLDSIKFSWCNKWGLKNITDNKSNKIDLNIRLILKLKEKMKPFKLSNNTNK